MAVGAAIKLIFAGLGTPRLYRWIVLGGAAVVEGYLVSLVADRNTFGSRQFWMWMLVVVAATFSSSRSHGPLCGILAVVCLANAFVGLKAFVGRLPGVLDGRWRAESARRGCDGRRDLSDRGVTFGSG
jgi:hypothetical protein